MHVLRPPPIIIMCFSQSTKQSLTQALQSKKSEASQVIEMYWLYTMYSTVQYNMDYTYV